MTKIQKNRWRVTELYFQCYPDNGGSAALIQAALYDGCYNNPIVRTRAIQNFKKLKGQWRNIALKALKQNLVKDVYVREVAELVLKEMTLTSVV